MPSDKPRQKQEGEDRSAFQIGDDPGEGGQRDILSDAVESPDEEFTGTAKTGEQINKQQDA
jgi:hypothetical protein